MTTQNHQLDYVEQPLRKVITRLMREKHDLEFLCTYLPRLANVAINLVRANNATPTQKFSVDANEIRLALLELTTPEPEAKES